MTVGPGWILYGRAQRPPSNLQAATAPGQNRFRSNLSLETRSSSCRICLFLANLGVLRAMPHITSPTVPPAISVWTLVVYSSVGNDSTLTSTPVSAVNFGSMSFSVSSSDPVRTCMRRLPLSFLVVAGAAWAAGEALVAGGAAAAGAAVAAGAAAGAAGLAASAGLVSAGLESAGLAAGWDDTHAESSDAAPNVPSRPAAPRSSDRRLIVEDMLISPSCRRRSRPIPKDDSLADSHSGAADAHGRAWTVGYHTEIPVIIR